MNKKLLFFFLLILLKTGSFAQPFGANNATWHFDITTISPNALNFIQATGSGPFLFNGDTCYRISMGSQFGCWIDTSFIVKQSNDSVYYYLQETNHFVMLYNYNAMVGDTQTIYGKNAAGGDTSIQVIVTSVGMTNVNGFPKRTYTIVRASSTHYFDFSGVVIEDVGCTYFLFPQWGFCDPAIHGIRCYEDSVVGLKNYSQFGYPCDTIITTGINESELAANIAVSPNPFAYEISIQVTKPEGQKITFAVKDMLGRILYEAEENNHSDSYTKTISLDFLPGGSYFLVISAGKDVAVKKITKE